MSMVSKMVIEKYFMQYYGNIMMLCYIYVNQCIIERGMLNVTCSKGNKIKLILANKIYL